MPSAAVNEYISRRYDRWHDYSKYQAGRAGTPDEAGDILNEVMMSLLQKDPRELDRLLSRDKKSYSHPDQVYTELDFFVLKMIELNATSKTSPWRHKNKGLPTDENVSFGPSNFGYRDPDEEDPVDELFTPAEDPEEPEPEDPVDTLLERWNRAREILRSLNIPAEQKQIFAWKVFAGNPLSSWPGPESYTSTCNCFNQVKKKVAYLAQLGEEDQVQRLAVRLLKASINERNENLRNQDIRIRRLASALLSVKPVLQGVA
jgi:hypothetical protein